VSTLAVFDCMLFFRAAARPQRTYATFRLIEEARITLCMSADVLAEIRDVLNRPEHHTTFAALTPKAVDAFLARYLRAVNWFPLVPDLYTVQRDPKDSKYVNLALAAEALYLLTTDRDLLDLMKSETPEGRDFIQRFPKLKILDPVAFLHQLPHAQ
jgi:putative PIN family toxin of toxin-antitoxin system